MRSFLTLISLVPRLFSLSGSLQRKKSLGTKAVHGQLEYCSSIWDPRCGAESICSHQLEVQPELNNGHNHDAIQKLVHVTDMLNEFGWCQIEQLETL